MLDDLGAPVELPRSPRRVVSLVPSLTEAIAATVPGQVVQFERLGYYALDPDHALLFHRTVGLRDEWAAIQRRQR